MIVGENDQLPWKQILAAIMTWNSQEQYIVCTIPFKKMTWNVGEMATWNINITNLDFTPKSPGVPCFTPTRNRGSTWSASASPTSTRRWAAVMASFGLNVVGAYSPWKMEGCNTSFLFGLGPGFFFRVFELLWGELLWEFVERRQAQIWKRSCPEKRNQKISSRCSRKQIENQIKSMFSKNFEKLQTWK